MSVMVRSKAVMRGAVERSRSLRRNPPFPIAVGQAWRWVTLSTSRHVNVIGEACLCDVAGATILFRQELYVPL